MARALPRSRFRSQRAWQPMFSMFGVYGAPPRHALICSGEGGESIVVPGGDERGKGQRQCRRAIDEAASQKKTCCSAPRPWM